MRHGTVSNPRMHRPSLPTAQTLPPPAPCPAASSFFLVSLLPLPFVLSWCSHLRSAIRWKCRPFQCWLAWRCRVWCSCPRELRGFPRAWRGIWIGSGVRQWRRSAGESLTLRLLIRHERPTKYSEKNMVPAKYFFWVQYAATAVLQVSVGHENVDSCRNYFSPTWGAGGSKRWVFRLGVQDNGGFLYHRCLLVSPMYSRFRTWYVIGSNIIFVAFGCRGCRTGGWGVSSRGCRVSTVRTVPPILDTSQGEGIQ